MVTKVALSFANIFMREIETRIIQQSNTKPKVWKSTQSPNWHQKSENRHLHLIKIIRHDFRFFRFFPRKHNHHVLHDGFEEISEGKGRREPAFHLFGRFDRKMSFIIQRLV